MSTARDYAMPALVVGAVGVMLAVGAWQERRAGGGGSADEARVLTLTAGPGAGRGLPHLYVLTLEGAGEGPPLTARAGVRGAQYVGPRTPGSAVYFTTAIAGTPTFVALDSGGHATRVLPGYPGLASMRGWLAVMDGTRAMVD